MIECKAKTTEENTQKVDITLGGDTHELVVELAAICGTVIEELKPQLKVPVDEFVKKLADMVLAALEEREDESVDRT